MLSRSLFHRRIVTPDKLQKDFRFRVHGSRFTVGG
jgi:hypothetical protein